MPVAFSCTISKKNLYLVCDNLQSHYCSGIPSSDGKGNDKSIGAM